MQGYRLQRASELKSGPTIMGGAKRMAEICWADSTRRRSTWLDWRVHKPIFYACTTAFHRQNIHVTLRPYMSITRSENFKTMEAHEHGERERVGAAGSRYRLPARSTRQADQIGDKDGRSRRQRPAGPRKANRGQNLRTGAKRFA